VGAQLASRRPGRHADGMAKPFAKLLSMLTPKRRWSQFSLLTLFLVVTVLCVGLRLIVVPAENQRRAVAAIRAAGGTVLYEFEDSRPWRSASRQQPKPSKIQQWLGRDYFDRVVEVRYPKINRNGVGAYDLDEKARRPVGDTLSDWLPGLPDLQRLEIHDDSLTDKGLRKLSSLTALEELKLTGAQITDNGLVHISSLRRLKLLSLQGVSATRDAIRRSKFVEWNRDDLNASQLGDEGIQHLTVLKGLEKLTLTGRGITDAGLVHIATFNGLRELSLTETSVTRDGMNRLRKALPKTWTTY
jgi:hypothetical protein